tara:strand:- start:486 stop:623 length:138 start_codon:yes stop_codon:yes gene_type:complete
MQKVIPFSLLLILFSCGGGGGASVDSIESETLTVKDIPERISIFE